MAGEGEKRVAAIRSVPAYGWKDVYKRQMLIAADGESMLIVSGTGEVIDPDDGIAAIGSGGKDVYKRQG